MIKKEPTEEVSDGGSFKCKIKKEPTEEASDGGPFKGKIKKEPTEANPRKKLKADATTLKALSAAEKLLRKLTPEEKDMIDSVFDGKGSDNDVLATFNGGVDVVKRVSMNSLQPEKWLNDEVVNCFLKGPLKRREQALCHEDPQRKPSHFFSSFFIQNIYLENEHDRMYMVETWDASEWNLVPCIAEGTPWQPDSYNCGVFVCMFADFLSQNLPLVMDMSHISKCRELIALSIMTGEAFGYEA
eukprot:scaffold4809_cov131-Skeletonema_marinoi.AAC.1